MNLVSLGLLEVVFENWVLSRRYQFSCFRWKIDRIQILTDLFAYIDLFFPPLCVWLNVKESHQFIIVWSFVFIFFSLSFILLIFRLLSYWFTICFSCFFIYFIKSSWMFGSMLNEKLALEIGVLMHFNWRVFCFSFLWKEKSFVFFNVFCVFCCYFCWKFYCYHLIKTKCLCVCVLWTFISFSSNTNNFNEILLPIYKRKVENEKGLNLPEEIILGQKKNLVGSNDWRRVHYTVS